jgi:hypothetical protein
MIVFFALMAMILLGLCLFLGGKAYPNFLKSKPKGSFAEYIGPDKDRVLIEATVTSHHGGVNGSVVVCLTLQSDRNKNEARLVVTKAVAARFPVGETVRFALVEPKPN